MVSAALMPLNSTMIAVVLPDIAADTGSTASTATQVLVGAYLVTAIVLQSPGGKIGDRIGHWRLLRLGQVAVLLGAALGTLGPNMAALGLGRVLMAMGGAALVPATVALMRLELPPEKRGGAFGAFGAVMALAAAAGPLVGGELSVLFGWRSVFVLNLPIVVASAMVIALCRLEAQPRPAGPAPRFDWVGSLLLGLSLTAAIVALRTSGTAVAVLLTAAVAVAVVFWWQERRVADPVIDFGLFRSRTFTAGTFVVALQNLAMYSLVFQIPIVSHVVLGLGAAETGRLLISMMLAMVVLSLASGRLTDLLGARALVLVGSAVALAGVATLGLLNTESTGTAIAAPLALCGAGIGMCTAPAQAAAQNAAPGRSAGMAAGITSTLRYLGGVIGVAVLGIVLVDTDGPMDVLGQHRSLLFLYAGAVALSAVVGVLLPGKART